MEKYYKILGLETTATLKEVKEKYNQLIEEFNPEKQEDDLKSVKGVERIRSNAHDKKSEIKLEFSSTKNFQTAL